MAMTSARLRGRLALLLFMLVATALLLLPSFASAQGLPGITSTTGPGGKQTWSLSVQMLVLITSLSFLPALLLSMTSFTRILIVLHFLRQALGTQNAPPAQLVAAMAILLSGFVMAPTLTAVHRDAIQPWMNGQIEQGEMLERGAKPFRAFMLRQTRDHDLQATSSSPRPAPTSRRPM